VVVSRVRVSGIGGGAKECKKEIDEALQNFPNLKFNYPGPEALKVMKRDLEKGAIKKLTAERMLDGLNAFCFPKNSKLCWE